MSKNKPQRHKESNVFRFKSFGDRIEQINLRHTALYRIQHVNEEQQPGEKESRFHQTYIKWTVLNLTDEYNAFQRQIRNIITYEQVVYQREFIVERLLKALATCSPISVQPLLEFVVALAEDLHKEFHPYFAAFLERLIALLRTQDAEQLEWTFTCLALLIKPLKSFLKKNINVVLNAIMPLLDRRQPEHITNFAAECFSFVARDIRDNSERERFLGLVLGALRAHTNGVKGCARLLFEMMRGVGGALHSEAAELLAVLLRALHKTEQFDAELLHEVLTETMLNLLHSTNVSSMSVFWEVAHRVVHEQLDAAAAAEASEEEEEEEETDTEEPASAATLRRLLQLVGQAVEFRHGKMVGGPPDALIATLMRVLDSEVAAKAEALLQCASELVAACLLCTNLTVTQLDASRVCRKVLAVATRPVFEAFVWNVRGYAQFALLVWPDFVRYFEQHCAEEPVQELLCRLVAEKSPPQRDGLAAGGAKFALAFRKAETVQRLEQVIEEAAQSDRIGRLEPLLMALQLWPHMLGADVDRLQSSMLVLVERIVDGFELPTAEEKTSTPLQDETNRRQLFMLSAVVESVLQAQRPHWLPLDTLLDTLLPLCRNTSNCAVAALGQFDLLISTAAAEHITYALFERIHATIAPNLAAPGSRQRLLAAHILQHFGRLAELLPPGDAETEQTVYEICVYVESQKADIGTYRDQLVALQRLAADQRLFENVRHTVCATDALRYLFGTLYISFRLLWKPVTAIIATYAQILPTDEFWPVFRAQLDATVECIRRPRAPLEPSAGLGDRTANMWLLDAYCAMWAAPERRTDYVHYRVQLWTALAEFGTLSEVRNRDVVQLLLDFLEHEYRRSHENDTLRWNLLRSDAETTAAANAMDVADDDEEDEETTTGADRSSNSTLKGTQKSLIAIITVFTRLSNPSQIHRHAEVYALWLELLCHRNPAIQKLALDCIMAHKHKYLQPYRDHLYGIVDEVKFKDAIALFKVDARAADNVVQPEHRYSLMAIVVRILYSKMTAKAQKGGGQARKALVMRFLGECGEAEVLQLLRMAFVVYEPWLAADAGEQSRQIAANCQLHAVLSPKKLQSTLNLIEIIREQFGGLMGANLHAYLLQVLFAVGACVEAVLLHVDQVQPVHGKLFKHLRAVGQQSVANFCSHIDTYPWTAAELDAMFALYVQPQLSRLPAEGIHAATPLLKLFTVFSKNSRYFVLFTRLPMGTSAAVAADDNSTDGTPMRYIIDLLLGPKTKPLVCLAIMEMIQSLLQLSDDATPSDDAQAVVVPIPALPTVNCRPTVRPPTLADINLGSAILLPYMPQILLKFQQNVGKRRGLTRRDLLIVSLCTRLVTDSASAEQLLAVLLPILVRKSTSAATSSSSSGEEELQQAVTTIQNLFERIEEPARHWRRVSPMFGQITGVAPRRQLCDLLEAIARRAKDTDAGPRLLRTAEIVRSLNAWNRRWVQQPDYELRYGAFRRIAELQAAGELDLDLCVLCVHHWYHFVRHDKDLLECASQHVRSMLPAMVRQLQAAPEARANLDYLIGDVVLNLVRRTINDRVDTVRTEGVLLLGELARECPDAHPVLADLQAFTDRHDPEIDFFHNLVNIQKHRPTRALARFCSVARQLERAPQSRTLTQFVLPLTTQYLCQERYAAEHGLVTAAIETVAVVARFLPWHQYELLLKYYLKKMRHSVDHQKQLVRLVMQILDAFHFDLSRARVVKAELPANVELETSAAATAEIAAVVEEPAAALVAAATQDGEEDIVVGGGDDDDDTHAADELDAVLGGEADADAEEPEALDQSAAAAEPNAKRPRLAAAVDRPVVLSQAAAKRLVHTIATGLIPQLNAAITNISTYESFHKLNKQKRRSEREEEEILRVPIALAVVKLLQKMPEAMLAHSLPGILVKVCQFLKSPLRSVRMCTRDILKSIMLAVGCAHLDTLLQQMTALLTRGFQVHVLTVTVHAVLDALKLQLRAGDMDRNLQPVLAVIVEDIFGRTADEKAVHKIGRSTPEAMPSNKSYQTLHIVAQNVGCDSLVDLLLPFREQLQRTQSRAIVGKVQECCQRVVQGLVLNKRLPIEQLLQFIYLTASGSIPALLLAAGVGGPGGRPQLSERERERLRRQPVDCYLIQAEPRTRSGAITKVVRQSAAANAHVLVEFALDALHILLKRGKLVGAGLQPYCGPLVEQLVAALSSTHIRVTTYALKCLAAMWTRDMQLPELREAVGERIVPQIFGILHKYATAAGMASSNENVGLAKCAFKAMVALLRCCEYFTVGEEQLRTLLLYVEQNLHDAAGGGGGQSIAFNLLKVIVGRKLLVAEMHEVMRKIGAIVVTADSVTARQDAKAIMVNYLMDYPLGKKVDGFLKFFVANLGYEEAAGRESAIALVHAIVRRFPQEVLNDKAGFLFLSLGARLVNDESAECRRLVAECLETLIGKLTRNNREQLFEIVLQLLADAKSSHREMAALMCTRFVVAEKAGKTASDAGFEARIGRVLPLLVAALSTSGYRRSATAAAGGGPVPGQFVRLAQATAEVEAEADEEMATDDEDEDEAAKERRDELAQRTRDHQIIQVQNTLLKILETFPEVLERDYAHYLDEMAFESQRLLAYEHVWVRLSAARLLDTILARLDVERVREGLLTDAANSSPTIADEDDGGDAPADSGMEFIYSNLREQLKSLCLDMCAQLLPEATDEEMAAQVSKNLLYVANLIREVPLGKQQKPQAEDPDDDAEEADKDRDQSGPRAINLVWLVRRMRYVVHAEVAKAPHSIVLRSAVFRWIEGLAELLPADTVRQLAPALLTPVVREQSEDDKNIDPRLRQLALKVGNTVRQQIGDDPYNLLRIQLQQRLMIKRAERRRLVNQVKVLDPRRAALRKEGERTRKKVAHKRKMDVLKGRAAPKRKKAKRTADADDLF